MARWECSWFITTSFTSLFKFLHYSNESKYRVRFHFVSIDESLCCVSFQVGGAVGADLYNTCPSDELPHVIGHSLGGQVAHVIGRTFISMGGKLDRYVQLQFYIESFERF